MNESMQVVLALFTAATPFVLIVLAWMRNTSRSLTQLHLDVVERSARQDTTLDDHERRITDIEHLLH